MMKGLQGERLRQAFKYLDQDQDGFIRPDQFKRIILVCFKLSRGTETLLTHFSGNCRSQALRRRHPEAPHPLHLDSRRAHHVL